MTSQRALPTIKYRINAKSPEALIEEVQVARESTNFMYVGTICNDRRLAKRSGYHEYHDTWDDAFFALTNAVTKRLMAAREELRAAKELVSRVAALKKQQDEKSA